MLALAEQLAGASRDDRQREGLETLADTARDLLQTLDGMLDLARKGPRAPTTVSGVDLHALLRGVHALYAPLAATRGIELDVVPPDRRYALRRRDGERLRRILLNLTDNAVKFTRAGHVLVRVRVMHGERHGHRLRVVVQDTGTGIARDRRRTVFRAFARARPPAPGGPGGCGLGLHLVERLVALMHGTIACRSTPGRGSVFLVTVPLALALARRRRALPAALPIPAVLVPGYGPLARRRRTFYEAAGLVPVDQATGRQGIVLVEVGAAALRAGRVPRCLSGRPGDWPRIACTASRDPAHGQRLVRAGYAGVITPTACPRRFRARLDAILAATTPPRPKPPRRGACAQVLVVDDQRVNRALLRHYGAALGARTDTAATPAAALERLGTRRYDLILLDLRLAGADGRALARRVRAGPGGNRRTPIVALTADSTADAAALVPHGIDALLLKPVTLAAFDACLQRWHCPRQPAAAAAGPSTRPLRRLLRRQLPTDRARFQALAEAGDHAQLARAAHALLGASLYCEAPALTRTLRRLQAAASRTPNAVNAALQDTLAAIDACVSDWEGQ